MILKRLIFGVLFVLFFSVTAELFSIEPIDSESLERAADNGLNYFRKRLDAGIMPGDGAFRNDVGITALVGMAFLSSGSTPLEGPDAKYTAQCVRLILEKAGPDGILAGAGASEQGSVYAHGFAVTFLAECLGMSENDGVIRGILEKAVQRIVESQGENGGWRYSFLPGEEDVSVTACHLTALRACRNAGLAIPAQTVEKGIRYLLRCQNPDGGFRYRLAGGPSAWPRSAAAVSGLCAAGKYDSLEIRRAMDYLRKIICDSSAVSPEDGYFHYAQYYAVQAFRLTLKQNEIDDSDEEVFCRLWKFLLHDQRPDGSWPSTISVDYATSMALVAILMKNDYLPIFQR